jgi:hypothetical protein
MQEEENIEEKGGEETTDKLLKESEKQAMMSTK